MDGHAHPSHHHFPLGEGRFQQQQTPNRPLLPNPESSQRGSPRSVFETPLSLPQRRLQLRHAGFRAPHLPATTISSRISRWFSDRENSQSPARQDTTHHRQQSPVTIKRRRTPSNDFHSRILNHITSTNRSRHSDQSKFVTVYEDESPSRSWYQDASSAHPSPQDDMKLREISGNARRSPPPLSSPLVRQLKGRSKRGLNLRKTSFSASEHIVYLENKLEETEKSMYSPNSGTLWKDKLAALSAENNRLQGILEELEQQFETRLREAVEHKTDVEVSLRRRIKVLQADLAEAETRNHSSKLDPSSAEGYRATIEKLEADKKGLEETNRSLEKRNDVLTGLLGQSPTRSHMGFEFPSPVRRQSEKNSRPSSMMHLASSPLTTASSSHSQMLRELPSRFHRNYFSPLATLNRELDRSCLDDNVDPEKPLDDFGAFDSGIGESCSNQSVADPASKRSSLQSFTLRSPASWGLPPVPSPTEHQSSDYSARKRTTRRFASGSTQLKPLVLPTLNSQTMAFQSVPMDFCSSPVSRQPSGQSMDPTVSFLSRPQDTPTRPRRRSKSLYHSDSASCRSCDSLFESADGGLGDPIQSLQGIGVQIEASEPVQDRTDCLVQLPQDSQQGAAHTRLLSSSGFEDVPLASDSVSQIGALPILSSNDNLEGRNETEPSTERGELQPEHAEHFSAGVPFETPPAKEPWEFGRLEDYTGAEESPPRTSSETIFPNPLAPAALSSFDVNQLSSSRQSSYDHGQHESNCIPCQSRNQQETHDKNGPSTSPWPRASLGFLAAERGLSNPLRSAQSVGPNSAHSSQSPLNLLQSRRNHGLPLSLTTKTTTFGMVSRYTSYLQVSHENRTNLARRVIANAWHTKWHRLSKASWWVFALFAQPALALNPRRRKDWPTDAENIERGEYQPLRGSAIGPVQCYTPTSAPERSKRKRVQFQNEHRPPSRWRQRQTVDDLDFDVQESERRTWGHLLYMWGKFSIVIILAIGGAITQGPEAMLRDLDSSSGSCADQTGSRHSDCAEEDTLYESSLTAPEEMDEEMETELDGRHSVRSQRSSGSASSATPRPSRNPISSASITPSTFGRLDSDQKEAPKSGAGSCAGTRARTDGDATDQGTLQWMQNLSVRDFQRLRPASDDGDRTMRPSLKRQRVMVDLTG